MLKSMCLIWTCVFTILMSSLCLSDAIFFNNLDIFGNSDKISNGMEDIQMILYKGSRSKTIMPHNYTLARSQELLKHIDLNKPYVLYIHGFEEHPSNESIRTIVSAYVQRESDNIVILDWSALAFGNYLDVALRVQDISKYTAKTLEKLVAAGLKVDNLHVIGHSLGAQIAGFIGRYLHFKIPRVTALDPANPLFYQFNAEHIDKTSGRQVDVLHTDGGIYGAFPATGNIDFFANSGSRPQPGCPLFGVPLSPRSFCSHWRSWRFYAESVLNNTAFPAVECKSYDSFRLGECKNNRIIYFGYSTPLNASGTYYFTTNDKPPYGKGDAGINVRK